MQRNLPENKQRALTAAGASYQDVEADDTPQEIAHVALSLMVELGALVHLFTMDVTRGGDLEEVARRWVQRLMTLVEMLERIAGTRGEQRFPAANGTMPIRTAPHSEHSSVRDDDQDRTRPRSRQSLRLTTREREIMELTRKGYPPKEDRPAPPTLRRDRLYPSAQRPPQTTTARIDEVILTLSKITFLCRMLSLHMRLYPVLSHASP